MDKIKEANKELFAQDDGDDADGEGDGNVDNKPNDSDEKELELMSLTVNRKVSFAANLEVYEPQSGISLQELENKLGKETAEDEEGCGELPKVIEDTTCLKLEVINEEEFGNDIEIENPSSPVKSETHLNCLQPEGGTEIMFSQENEAIEEICEEILVMDMENDNKTEVVAITNGFLPKSMSGESPGAVQRKMLKQITFDYDEDEPDNKSLTNLLISDNENEEEDEHDEDEQAPCDGDSLNVTDELFDYNCNESLLEDSDNEEKIIPSRIDIQNEDYYHANNDNKDYDDDEDEDDKLSIIVASYLPDDNFDCDKASLTSDNKCSHQAFRTRSRFSFKRKSKHSNVVGSISSSNYNSSSNRRFLPPPEVTDLKLHYKTCCEFKNAQQKLPKYTGYLSEYGLTRDQLEEREQKLQQKQHSLLQQTLKTSEAEMRKMHDNERAFTTWLKNKMRFPINKTRNMFDVKRPFGLRKCTSVGGTQGTTSCRGVDGGGSDDNNIALIPHTTRYRSISAKFKKK